MLKLEDPVGHPSFEISVSHLCLPPLTATTEDSQDTPEHISMDSRWILHEFWFPIRRRGVLVVESLHATIRACGCQSRYRQTKFLLCFGQTEFPRWNAGELTISLV